MPGAKTQLQSTGGTPTSEWIRMVCVDCWLRTESAPEHSEHTGTGDPLVHQKDLQFWCAQVSDPVWGSCPETLSWRNHQTSQVVEARPGWTSTWLPAASEPPPWLARLFSPSGRPNSEEDIEFLCLPIAAILVSNLVLNGSVLNKQVPSPGGNVWNQNGGSVNKAHYRAHTPQRALIMFRSV